MDPALVEMNPDLPLTTEGTSNCDYSGIRIVAVDACPTGNETEVQTWAV